MNKSVYPSQKTKIIESAEKLILKKGPGSLKTDAIIEASGLSKGGFFYHFKTIDDLLLEVGKKSWREFLEIVYEEALKDPEPKGRYIRSYLKISLFGSSKKKTIALNNIFLEVILANKSIIEKIKKENTDMDKLFKEMSKEDGLTPQTITLIQMAADGIWINELIGTIKMNKKEKTAFYEYLTNLTH